MMAGMLQRVAPLSYEAWLDYEVLGGRLTDADLSGTDLRQCVFHDASCVGARFERANLREADLSNADLTRTNWVGADLFRARLHGVEDEDAAFDAGRALALGDDADLLEAQRWTPKH